jgi:nitrate/TMAO reductase-like tetraheme cytochrome c subunit
MIRFLERLFDKLDQGLSPREKTVLVSILLIISIAGIVLAIRYYRYIQKDPEFCNSCHLMKEAYTAWKQSGHRFIVCQDCHKLGIVEQNRLLIKFVFTTDRATPEPHGNVTPWQTCTKCHWEEATQQGGISVTRSTGHARHITVEKLTCMDCHTRSVHAFRPDKRACLRCHKDWRVHGVGMEEASCMSCHPFSPKIPGGFIPDRERCLSCHRSSSKTVFPEKAPMARLNCYECHRPHHRVRPVDDDCLRCHSRAMLHKQNASVHRSGNRCIACHVPHRWKAR